MVKFWLSCVGESSGSFAILENMENNDTERIDFLKNGLIECKKKQRRIIWILSASIIVAWLINQYFISDAVVSYCLFLGVGTPFFWIFINLRRVYSSLKEAYEAELDAIKINQ